MYWLQETTRRYLFNYLTTTVFTPYNRTSLSLLGNLVTNRVLVFWAFKLFIYKPFTRLVTNNWYLKVHAMKLKAANTTQNVSDAMAAVVKSTTRARALLSAANLTTNSAARKRSFSSARTWVLIRACKVEVYHCQNRKVYLLTIDRFSAGSPKAAPKKAAPKVAPAKET